ncbi:hypothetical protein DFP72DRAFT_1065351 [Ephemerocybe angulata]|uniref:Secreted protein n=1 Tax=Ephemerocybe angulata TaxID=980116 RepID=A0A8H6I552_9AGAR|nr:hypothetical protein DFP72DRAFT_1065351 [Tulosesus angulatus]
MSATFCTMLLATFLFRLVDIADDDFAGLSTMKLVVVAICACQRPSPGSSTLGQRLRRPVANEQGLFVVVSPHVAAVIDRGLLSLILAICSNIFSKDLYPNTNSSKLELRRLRVTMLICAPCAAGHNISEVGRQW